MFQRAIHDLVYRAGDAWCADEVEMYHRLRLEQGVGTYSGLHGAMAYARIRVRQGTKVREAGIGGWIPEWPVVNQLLELAVPEESEAPFQGSAVGNSSCVPTAEPCSGETNMRGYVRDIMATSGGLLRVAESDYACYRTASVLYRCRPELCTSGTSDAIVLAPEMVLELIKAGAFRGKAAGGPPIHWFHRRFDGLGQSMFRWARTPRTLRLVSGSIMLVNLPKAAATGLLVNRLSIDDTRVTVNVNRKGRCCLHLTDMDGGYAVSRPFDFFDGAVNASLPYVELKGDWSWY